MTMAAAIEDRTADANAWSRASRIAERRYRSRPRAPPRPSGAASKARRHRSRRISASISSTAWQHQRRRARGPCSLHRHRLRRERRPLLLLPLALRHAYGVRCASFMGGKHSTFNMALWDQDFAASATPADLDAPGIGDIANAHEADVLALHQQPLRWRDLPNPIALLPHQPSANDCPLLTMAPGAAPAGAGQQLVPPPPQGQGAQAAVPARLSLSHRDDGCRHQAAARLVLPHQAAADGRAETAQRVRRSRHRGFRPRRLH